MILQTHFNSTELDWVEAPDNWINGSCHIKINGTRQIEKCQKWSYDKTYYGETRATEVKYTKL